LNFGIYIRKKGPRRCDRFHISRQIELQHFNVAIFEEYDFPHPQAESKSNDDTDATFKLPTFNLKRDLAVLEPAQ